MYSSLSGPLSLFYSCAIFVKKTIKKYPRLQQVRACNVTEMDVNKTSMSLGKCTNIVVGPLLCNKGFVLLGLPFCAIFNIISVIIPG